MSVMGSLKSVARRILPHNVWKWLGRQKEIFIANQGIVRFLVVSVGQACNFKCRDCGNFAPYSPAEFRRYHVDDIIRDLDVIFKNIRRLDCLQIQGGEPFLYTDLDKIVNYLGSKLSRSGGVLCSIVIATNGSIMPSDELLRTIKENDVTIRISDYNIVHDKAIALKNKCDELGIHCYYYEFVGQSGMWNLCGGVNMAPEPDDVEVNRRFEQCGFRGCLTLERGELSYCSRATNSYIIQHFERKPGDYLTVSDDKDFKRKLRHHIARKHPMEACRYCYGTDDKYLVRPAIQLEGDV